MNFTHFAVLILVRPARIEKAKCYLSAPHRDNKWLLFTDM